MRASVPLADSVVIKPDSTDAAASTAVRRSPLLKTTPRTAAVLRSGPLGLRCSPGPGPRGLRYRAGPRGLRYWAGPRGLRRHGGRPCVGGEVPEAGRRGRDIAAPGWACASLFFALGAGIRCVGAGDWLSGRAPRSHRGGHWFDPSIAHPAQKPVAILRLAF
jgi:hypothetical protein